MTYDIRIEEVSAQPVAAVVQPTPLGQIGATLIAGLDKVYAVLRRQGVRPLGHNVGIYREAPTGELVVCSAVQTSSAFEPEGEVALAETPAGKAATTTHWGAYNEIPKAHAAITAWRAARGLGSSVNWEVYGDWNDDPALCRTDIYHLIDGEPAP